MFIKKKPPTEGSPEQRDRSQDYSLFVDGDAPPAPPAQAARSLPDGILDAEEPRLSVHRRPSGLPTTVLEDVQEVPDVNRFSKFVKAKVAASEPLQAPAKGGLFGAFKKAGSKEAVTPEAVPTAPAKSMFSRAPKVKLEPKAKPEAKPSVKAKNATPTRTGAPKSSFDVLVELENNKRVCWRVTANGLEDLDIATVSTAASFSKNEHRFATDKPMAYGAAQDLALSEIGEEVRIVNGSKSTGAVYSSTAVRITDIGALRTGPGLYLLDLLIREVREPEEELVFGLVLSGGEANRSLAVLYHLSASNEVTSTQITVNPENLSFVLSQFSASRRIDEEKTKFVIFKNADLLKVASQLVLYPNEAMWNGISLRKVLWGLTLVSGVVALGAGAYGAQNYLGMTSTKSALARQTALKKTALTNIDKKVASAVTSFAGTQALMLPRIAQRAGGIWQPGSKVVVDAILDKEEYRVTAPLTTGSAEGMGLNVLQRRQLQDLAPLLSVAPPEGCTKAIPNISGGMNAIQITVTCENALGSLSAYRLN